MAKPERLFRADTLRHAMNADKEAAVRRFVADYRRVAVGIGREQWRLFFDAGRTNKNWLDKALNAVCGAAPVQMARRQSVEQIDGWVSNRANEFRTVVQASSLPPESKRMLHVVNRMKAWFGREDIAMRDTGEVIPVAVRKLARSIMRHVMARHNRPDLSRVSPRLDSRIAAEIAAPRKAKTADLWVKLRLPNRGTINVPLLSHHRHDQRQGELCPVVQLVTGERGEIGVRLVTDTTDAFATSRAAYQPRTPFIGIDFGLCTLMATDKGDLLGRGWIGDLKRIDKQIVGIARHRMRNDEKPRDSARYRGLVTRLRGIIKTRVNAALNRIVAVHAPAELAVERLDFSHPDLSRRMNRLLRNCGRKVFNDKVTDLEQRFGIVTTEVNPAYTSRECDCGYVDGRNRRSQAEFACLWCGRRKHADANGAGIITKRRSLGLGLTPGGKGDILKVLVTRHVERWPDITIRHTGRKGTATDPRLTNPYYASWAAEARKLQISQGLVPCGQMQ